MIFYYNYNAYKQFLNEIVQTSNSFQAVAQVKNKIKIEMAFEENIDLIFVFLFSLIAGIELKL